MSRFNDSGYYHRLILENQLFTGKNLPFPIEQDNINIRHDSDRFRRKTKAVSKFHIMVYLSLRLLNPLLDPAN